MVTYQAPALEWGSVQVWALGWGWVPPASPGLSPLVVAAAFREVPVWHWEQDPLVITPWCACSELQGTPCLSWARPLLHSFPHSQLSSGRPDTPCLLLTRGS